MLMLKFQPLERTGTMKPSTLTNLLYLTLLPPHLLQTFIIFQEELIKRNFIHLANRALITSCVKNANVRRWTTQGATTKSTNRQL